jgi:hypothetical protein
LLIQREIWTQSFTRLGRRTGKISEARSKGKLSENSEISDARAAK